VTVRVGLTGGIASGKSTVAAILEELGAVVIDADKLAREVVAKGSPGLAEVVAAFGPAVLTPDGELDRPRMGAIVFADPERLKVLESITHPRIFELYAEREAAARDADVVVHDIPLLVESGRAEEFDAVVVVDASEDHQLERMLRDRGMSEEDARARMAAQATREQRRAVATYLIENTGTREALRRRVEEVYADLLALSGRDAPH
jgi:dephospho-CoA kinase